MDSIQTLFATEQIRALKSRYCRLIDLGQWDEFGRLFVPGAHFRSAGGNEAQGREGIVAMLRAATAGQPTLHLAYLPEISVSSETLATAIWGMEYYVAAHMAPNARGYGFSHDHYIRVGDSWFVSSVEMQAFLGTPGD